MKRFIKSRIFVSIITAIICISGTGYAEHRLNANTISYGSDSNVEEN